MPTERSTPWTTALTRRRALAAGGGLTTGLISARLTNADEATPATEASEAERILTMFVQTAQAGGFRPKEGVDGIHQLTLQGASAQTVYFSDRPHRIVGSVSTADFLAAIGFSSENPPNAAIVSQTADGSEDVLVVELINPEWNSGSQTLTYNVIVLEEYTGDNFGDLAQRQDDGALPESLGQTNLFIDDCPDVTQCWSSQHGVVGPCPMGRIPMCWDPIKYGNLLCSPCNTYLTCDELGEICHSYYPDKCWRQAVGLGDRTYWECTGT